MKMTLDYPPVWLIAALALGWGQAALLPLPLWGGAIATFGTAVAAVGGVLLLVAALSFLRARTTIVPHETPRQLITTGLYGLSRNPIYLADAMILAGLSLRWHSLLGLALVPVFVAVITVRFIRPEESRLHAAFGDAADAYFKRTRRWI